MRAVITVIGSDKVGIICRISRILADSQVNILDISQTIMQDLFTMIMLVDLANMSVGYPEIKSALEREGKDLGLSVRIQREEIFNSMHKI